MKKLLFLSLVGLALFYACKKDNKASRPDQTQTAQTLSDSLKIQYSVHHSGDIPGNVNSQALLKKEDTARAMSKKYVVLQPTVAAGFKTMGYYVKIQGANDYFEITTPAMPNGRKKAVHPARFARAADATDSAGAVIISLPENIPYGFFTIEYAAFDSLKNVSNIVSEIVQVVYDNSNTPEAQLFTGTWKYNAYKIGDQDWYYNLYKNDSLYQYYNCVNGKLQISVNPTDLIQFTQHSQLLKSNYTFNINGQGTNEIAVTELDLNIDNSGCYQPVYDDYSFDQNNKMYWLYKADTKQLIQVFPIDGILYIDIYDVPVLTSTRLVLGYNTYLYSSGNTITLDEYIKQ